MIDNVEEMNALSNFFLNTPELLRRIKETGEPVLLTVSDESEIVVQDAESYRKLIDLIDRLETVVAIKEAQDDVKNHRARPALKAIENLGIKYGVSRRSA